MGLIVCKKHGRQSLAELCPHVLAVFRANKAPVPCREARIHEEELGDTFDHWLCPECEASLDLPADLRVSLDDNNADLLFAHPSGPACILCFEEWRNGQQPTPDSRRDRN